MNRMLALLIAGILLTGTTAHAKASDAQLSAAALNPVKLAEVLAASETDADKAQAVAQVIWLIQNSDIAQELKTQRTALLIGRFVMIAGAQAPMLIGMVAERVAPAVLPVITAAAVLASGARSPEVLTAILAAAGKDETVVQALRSAAANPVALLGSVTVEMLRGLPPRSALAPAIVVDLPVQNLVPDRRPPVVERPPANQYPGQ